MTKHNGNPVTSHESGPISSTMRRIEAMFCRYEEAERRKAEFRQALRVTRSQREAMAKRVPPRRSAPPPGTSTAEHVRQLMRNAGVGGEIAICTPTDAERVHISTHRRAGRLTKIGPNRWRVEVLP
jgi:hypothetical protein